MERGPDLQDATFGNPSMQNTHHRLLTTGQNVLNRDETVLVYNKDWNGKVSSGRSTFFNAILMYADDLLTTLLVKVAQVHKSRMTL